MRTRTCRSCPRGATRSGRCCCRLEVQLATARSNILADLLSGVTTLRSMAQELDVDFLVRDEVAAGRTLGPDLVCSGVQLAKAGAHGHALTAVANEADIEALVERNASRGAGLIKIFVTGGVSSVASRPGRFAIHGRARSAAPPTPPTGTA